MADFMRIERVNALPSTLTPSTMYIVKGPAQALAEVVFVGNTVDEVRHIINQADINTMISNAVSQFSNIEVLANIAGRNALAPNRNVLALVLDATGDATVESGAALYVYEKANSSWIKVAEFESMDVTLTWDSIQGKPSSTPAQIDEAVNKAHSHANMAQLNKIGETVEGNLIYNGTIITGMAAISVAEW